MKRLGEFHVCRVEKSAMGSPSIYNHCETVNIKKSLPYSNVVAPVPSKVDNLLLLIAVIPLHAERHYFILLYSCSQQLAAMYTIHIRTLYTKKLDTYKYIQPTKLYEVHLCL